MKTLALLSLSATLALSGAAFAQSYPDSPSYASPYGTARSNSAPLFEGRGAAYDSEPSGPNPYTNGNMGIGGGPGIRGYGGGSR